MSRVRSRAAILPDPAVDDTPHGIWTSTASLHVDSASGSGVWLIDGDLTVASQLDFDGLLIVLGDILFSETSRVRIAGSLVQADPGRTLQSRGELSVDYDEQALHGADPEEPHLLERRARLIGWRDDSP